MRRASLLYHVVRVGLVLVCWGVLSSIVWATDLIEPVPSTSPAFLTLRQYGERGLLSVGWEAELVTPPARPLTRYDIAFLLIEPLQRLTALVEVDAHAALTPEAQRRHDLALQAIMGMSTSEYQTLVNTAGQMLSLFGDGIEALAPGLAHRAVTAVHQLATRDYRARIQSASSPPLPMIQVTVDTHAHPNSIIDPRSVLPVQSRLSLRMDGVDVPGIAVGTRPINSLEAALDVALKHLRLYGSFAALPGQDASQILRADLGRATVGVRLDFWRIHEMNISGIFELHVVRSWDSGITITDSGAVGGVGLSW